MTQMQRDGGAEVALVWEVVAPGRWQAPAPRGWVAEVEQGDERAYRAALRHPEHTYREEAREGYHTRAGAQGWCADRLAWLLDRAD